MMTMQLTTICLTFVCSLLLLVVTLSSSSSSFISAITVECDGPTPNQKTFSNQRIVNDEVIISISNTTTCLFVLQDLVLENSTIVINDVVNDTAINMTFRNIEYVSSPTGGISNPQLPDQQPLIRFGNEGGLLQIGSIIVEDVKKHFVVSRPVTKTSNEDFDPPHLVFIRYAVYKIQNEIRINRAETSWTIADKSAVEGNNYSPQFFLLHSSGIGAPRAFENVNVMSFQNIDARVNCSALRAASRIGDSNCIFYAFHVRSVFGPVRSLVFHNVTVNAIDTTKASLFNIETTKDLTGFEFDASDCHLIVDFDKSVSNLPKGDPGVTGTYFMLKYSFIFAEYEPLIPDVMRDVKRFALKDCSVDINVVMDTGSIAVSLLSLSQLRDLEVIDITGITLHRLRAHMIQSVTTAKNSVSATPVLAFSALYFSSLSSFSSAGKSMLLIKNIVAPKPENLLVTLDEVAKNQPAPHLAPPCDTFLSLNILPSFRESMTRMAIIFDNIVTDKIRLGEDSTDCDQCNISITNIYFGLPLMSSSSSSSSSSSQQYHHHHLTRHMTFELATSMYVMSIAGRLTGLVKLVMRNITISNMNITYYYDYDSNAYDPSKYFQANMIEFKRDITLAATSTTPNTDEGDRIIIEDIKISNITCQSFVSESVTDEDVKSFELTMIMWERAITLGDSGGSSNLRISNVVAENVFISPGSIRGINFMDQQMTFGKADLIINNVTLRNVSISNNVTAITSNFLHGLRVARPLTSINRLVIDGLVLDRVHVQTFSSTVFDFKVVDLPESLDFHSDTTPHDKGLYFSNLALRNVFVRNTAGDVTMTIVFLMSTMIDVNHIVASKFYFSNITAHVTKSGAKFNTRLLFFRRAVTFSTESLRDEISNLAPSSPWSAIPSGAIPSLKASEFVMRDIHLVVNRNCPIQIYSLYFAENVNDVFQVSVSNSLLKNFVLEVADNDDGNTLAKIDLTANFVLADSDFQVRSAVSQEFVENDNEISRKVFPQFILSNITMDDVTVRLPHLRPSSSSSSPPRSGHTIKFNCFSQQFGIQGYTVADISHLSMTNFRFEPSHSSLPFNAFDDTLELIKDTTFEIALFNTGTSQVTAIQQANSDQCRNVFTDSSIKNFTFTSLSSSSSSDPRSAVIANSTIKIWAFRIGWVLQYSKYFQVSRSSISDINIQSVEGDGEDIYKELLVQVFTGSVDGQRLEALSTSAAASSTNILFEMERSFLVQDLTIDNITASGAIAALPLSQYDSPNMKIRLPLTTVKATDISSIDRFTSVTFDSISVKNLNFSSSSSSSFALPTPPFTSFRNDPSLNEFHHVHRFDFACVSIKEIIRGPSETQINGFFPNDETKQEYSEQLSSLTVSRLHFENISAHTSSSKTDELLFTDESEVGRISAHLFLAAANRGFERINSLQIGLDSSARNIHLVGGSRTATIEVALIKLQNSFDAMTEIVCSSLYRDCKPFKVQGGITLENVTAINARNGISVAAVYAVGEFSMKQYSSLTISDMIGRNVFAGTLRESLVMTSSAADLSASVFKSSNHHPEVFINLLHLTGTYEPSSAAAELTYERSTMSNTILHRELAADSQQQPPPFSNSTLLANALLRFDIERFNSIRLSNHESENNHCDSDTSTCTFTMFGVEGNGSSRTTSTQTSAVLVSSSSLSSSSSSSSDNVLLSIEAKSMTSSNRIREIQMKDNELRVASESGTRNNNNNNNINNVNMTLLQLGDSNFGGTVTLEGNGFQYSPSSTSSQAVFLTGKSFSLLRMSEEEFDDQSSASTFFSSSAIFNISNSRFDSSTLSKEEITNVTRILTSTRTDYYLSASASNRRFFDGSTVMLDCNKWPENIDKRFDETFTVERDASSFYLQNCEVRTPSISQSLTDSRNTVSPSPSFTEHDTSVTRNITESISLPSSPSLSRNPSGNTPSSEQSSSQTVQLFFFPLGLDADALTTVTATAQMTTAIAGSFGGNPSLAMTMSRTIAAMQLIGCPSYNPETKGEWIDEDPGFSFTLLPTIAIGENPGKYYRAAIIGFLGLAALAAIAGLFARIVLKYNENSPWYALASNFVLFAFLPFLGTFFSTMGVLAVTSEPLDLVLIIIPFLFVISFGFLFSHKLAIGIKESIVKVRPIHSTEKEVKQIVQYHLQPTKIVLNRALYPESEKDLELLRYKYNKYAPPDSDSLLDAFVHSSFANKYIFAPYTWVRDEEAPKQERREWKKENNIKPGDDSKNESFTPSTSLLVIMPKLFVKLIGPTKNAQSYESLHDDDNDDDLMNNNDTRSEDAAAAPSTNLRDLKQQLLKRKEKKQAEKDEKNDEVTMKKKKKIVSGKQQRKDLVKNLNDKRFIFSPFYFLISALLAIVCNFIQGFSKGNRNASTYCVSAVLLNVFASVFSLILTLYLRPFIVQTQNYLVICLEIISTAVAITVFFFNQTSSIDLRVTSSDAEFVTTIQYLASIPASVIGTLAMTVAGLKFFTINILGVYATVPVTTPVPLEMPKKELLTLMEEDENDGGYDDDIGGANMLRSSNSKKKSSDNEYDENIHKKKNHKRKSRPENENEREEKKNSDNKERIVSKKRSPQDESTSRSRNKSTTKRTISPILGETEMKTKPRFSSTAAKEEEEEIFSPRRSKSSRGDRAVIKNSRSSRKFKSQEIDAHDL